MIVLSTPDELPLMLFEKLGFTNNESSLQDWA